MNEKRKYKIVLDYNYKEKYGWDFADYVVAKLKQLGFDADAGMDTEETKMTVWSYAPQNIVDDILNRRNK